MAGRWHKQPLRNRAGRLVETAECSASELLARVRGDTTPGDRRARGTCGYVPTVDSAAAPADTCRPFVPRFRVRLMSCRRPLSLGRRPAARLLDLFLQRGKADGESGARPADAGPPPRLERDSPRRPNRAGSHSAGAGPRRTGSGPQALPRGLGSALPSRAAVSRSGDRATKQVGLGDRVLQYQPSSLCTVRTDEVCPRPSDGLESPAEDVAHFVHGRGPSGARSRCRTGRPRRRARPA